MIRFIFLLCVCFAQALAFSTGCEGLNNTSGDWVRHGASCYGWFNKNIDYWYPAEEHCKRLGGHLVSINSEQENRLVGRLTYCAASWIGRYGVHADQLAKATYYRWTDGTLASANRHNFSRLATPHQPLLTAENLQWFNNFYHAKSSYVCEVPSSPPGQAENQTEQATGCLRDWHRSGDYCYLQPAFKATFIEAGYYCDGRQANLVSIHSEKELRLLSLLDLSEASCSLELWVGLVKLNPCRLDYFSGQKICFQWADRSGNQNVTFPEWAAGNPNGDLVTNCVVLKDRHLRSEPCHARRNFVCKRLARDTTPRPPTQPPPTVTPTLPPGSKSPTSPSPEPPTLPPGSKSPTSSSPEPPTLPPGSQRPTSPSPEPPTLPPGLIRAAYDFRRGIDNLAQPGRYRVLDRGGVVMGTQGAVLNGSGGILLDTESSALTRPLKRNSSWTIFYYVQRATDFDEILLDISGDKGEPGLSLLEHPNAADITIYGRAGFFKDESNMTKGAIDRQPWVKSAVVFSAGRATFYRNWVDVSTYSPATSPQPYGDNDRHLVLGKAYQSVLPGYRGAIACFGVAHVALTSEELGAAFRRYCP